MSDKYVCTVCGYIYNPEEGAPHVISFEDLPDDWSCPVCGVGKEMFEPENKQ
ncbi:MAG: rubredoxin [Synergistaceae bacterium]